MEFRLGSSVVQVGGKKSIAEQEERSFSSSATGEWTCILIRKLNKWIEREHDKMILNLTQAMNDHGCFNKYLFKIRKVNRAPSYSPCNQGQDDGPHHIFVEYEMWRRERHILVLSLQDCGGQNIVDLAENE